MANPRGQPYADLIRALRRARGIHVNPWGRFPRLITSVDYLKRDQPMRLFRETLPASGQMAYPRSYDMRGGCVAESSKI